MPATKKQILNHSAIGQECIKCKRIIDAETIENFILRNKLRNAKLIKFALAKATKRSRTGRKRAVNYNELLRLREKGLTYGQIALKMGIKKGSIAYIVRNYFTKNLDDLKNTKPRF